jgi:hypothetical protein
MLPMRRIVDIRPGRLGSSKVERVILTKRMRNEIFGILKDQAIDPRTCELEDGVTCGRMTYIQVELRHPVSGSVFRFWAADVVAGWEQYHFVALVGGATTRQPQRSVVWQELMHEVNDWAHEVRHEQQTHDLWKEMNQVPAGLTSLEQDDVADVPFTADELAKISERMDHVKEQVREVPDLTPAQLRAIEQAIDDLKQSSKTVSRKDLRLLLYGQAMNLFFVYAVPPHVVQTIITTAITGLAHILGLGSMPPSLPPTA